MRPLDRTLLLAAVLLIAGLVRLDGQARQQAPVFKSTVDVVSVDVNVVGQDGRPVRDLGAGDFTVKVDGQVRKIVSAQFVSVTAPPDAAPPATPADYSTNVGGPPGRLIAVVVDRGSIAPVQSKDVFTAASHFVETLQPSDRVALFSIPSGANIDFTTNHEAIVEALLQTDGEEHGSSGLKYVSTAEAIAFERGDNLTVQNVMQRECNVTSVDLLTPGGGSGEAAICVQLVRDEASTIAAYAHERARNTMNGLRGILERLGSSDTPKTLVLLSEGLVIDNERMVTSGLGHALAAAHATIYALKPEHSASNASQPRAAQNTAQERATRETGLSLVTRLGGGEMFRVIANPDTSFKRLASELSGYYLLGFEPQATDRDGKPHGISVDVRAPDVQVRSRSEFTVGLTAHDDPEHVVASLLRSPVAATGVPFRLTTYAFQDPDSPKIRLLVALEVDRSDTKGRMALGIALFKPDGQTGATFFQPSIEAPTDGATGTQTCFATLLVEPGNYVLKAALMDSSGRTGSLERPVRAYMTRIARFRVTQLLIGEGGSQPSAGSPIVPTVSGNLSGAELHAYMELFADAPGAFDGMSVTLEVVREGQSTVLDSAPAILQPAGTDERVRAAAGSLSLSLLPPGAYEARAAVFVDGRRAGAMTRPFRVVRQ